MEDKRIPIERFAEFRRCILVGSEYGIRFDACLEAMNETLARKRAERKDGACDEDEAAPEYVAVRGRAPVSAAASDGGAIGESRIKWYAPLPRRAVIIPPVVAGGTPEVLVVNDAPRVNRILSEEANNG